MNQHGWGIKELFAFIIVLGIALFITMMMYNRNFKDLFGGIDNSSYTKAESFEVLEKQLESSAYTYVDNYYYKVLENGDNDIVTVKTLEEENILKPVVYVDKKKYTCTGYVNFFKENGKTSYKPYLKCGDDYETKGYQAKYDDN